MKRRRDMFFGLILILIGVVFLLQNLGFLEGDVWRVIWPLILIIFGLSVIVRPILGEPKRGRGKREEK